MLRNFQDRLSSVVLAHILIASTKKLELSVSAITALSVRSPQQTQSAEEEPVSKLGAFFSLKAML